LSWACAGGDEIDELHRKISKEGKSMKLHRMPSRIPHKPSVAGDVEIEIGYFKGEELIDFKWATPAQFEEEVEKSKNSNIIVARLNWEESSDNPNNYTS
jgi:hypothetical protein